MANRLPILRSDRTSVRLPFRLTNATASRSPFAGPAGSLKVSVTRLLRALVPVLLSLTIATAAHAQGTMDFSGAQTLMGTFKTFAMYAGAVICLGGLIFAGIRMMSGRFQDAIPGLFGALFGAGVLGWGAGWIGSLTGQSM
ncbi:MAG: traI protein helicase [Acidobacteriaceae bacterium]|nr:traI protein helicase [Acidobacteriaceae bacterium]